MFRILFTLLITVSMATASAQTLRVATFNVSMDATNYQPDPKQTTGHELFDRLKTPEHPQIQNIAAIIQQVRPDIILLNEFDYTADDKQGVLAFLHNYLNRSQHGGKAINYPFYFTAPVNTGVDSGFDLDRDGVASGKGGDAFGYGLYPGHFGMVVLSKYPIDYANIRTFQHFLWKDMPNSLLPEIKDEQGKPWYSQEIQQHQRLSSKSHWDIPVKINGEVVHVLASHPTPPVFDGPENRNGMRNHDEIRFWVDYLTPAKSQYIYDDQGHKGGFSGQRFVLLGDMNASISNGDAMVSGIGSLLEHPAVNATHPPHSDGSQAHAPENPLAKYFTASWGMRADYVLPSKQGLKLVANGIFWPTAKQPNYQLIATREASSDHRLVWAELQITPVKP